MQNGQKPFGKRRTPIAEFKSVEEEFKKGELLKRREHNLAVFVTPLVAFTLIVVLVVSPETRAFAIELGAKVIDVGREWLLRGTLGG